MKGNSELEVCLELCEIYLPKYRGYYEDCVEKCKSKYGEKVVIALIF